MELSYECRYYRTGPELQPFGELHVCRIKLCTLAACCGIWGWALSPAPQDTSAQQVLYQDCVLLWGIADLLLELGDLAENLEVSKVAQILREVI